MPRTLSTTLLVEKNKLQSTHPWVYLFEVSIVGAPGPYRLAAYDQDVVFHGLNFLRAPLTLDALEEPTNASLVNLRVTVQNVDQEVISLLENYWASSGDPAWTCTIWTIDATQPNETPFFAGEVFTVQQCATDYVNASFDLVAEGLTLSMLLPKRRYTASNGYTKLVRR